MAKGIAAKRHAQAVFKIALERGELERWQADLKDIQAVLGEPQVAIFLENPKVRLANKIELVKGQFPNANPLALNLAYLLIAKRRLGLLNQTVAEYDRLVDAHNGVEQAEVITAVPLAEEDTERLGEFLSSVTGKRVRLATRVDSTVIGGLVARIGDKLIDGSTKNKLLALRNAMLRAAG